MLTVRLRRVECWAPEDFGSRPHGECSRAARSFNRPIASIAAGKFVHLRRAPSDSTVHWCFATEFPSSLGGFASWAFHFILSMPLPMQAAFSASGCACSAVHFVLNSSKLCLAHAFAIWPAIARAALRTARGMGGSLSGYKHQKRDCGGAHAGLSSLGAHNSGCFGDFAGVR